jgi:flagellar FliL protein
MAKEDVTLVPAPAKKSKLKLLLILLLIAVIGAGGFFGWRYFSPAPALAAAEGEASNEEASAEESGSAARGEHGEGERGAQSTVLNFEPFLVNLADKEISRYLRVTIRLQITSKQAAEKIASADVLTSQMRDSILGILSSRNSEQINTPEGKTQLKNEIAEKLNAFLPGKPVKAVFFTDFVVQL